MSPPATNILLSLVLSKLTEQSTVGLLGQKPETTLKLKNLVHTNISPASLRLKVIPFDHINK